MQSAGGARPQVSIDTLFTQLETRCKELGKKPIGDSLSTQKEINNFINSIKIQVVEQDKTDHEKGVKFSEKAIAILKNIDLESQTTIDGGGKMEKALEKFNSIINAKKQK
jgi:hypothetical protein